MTIFDLLFGSIVWPELIYRWSPLCRSVAILLQSPSMPQEEPTVASSQTPPYFTLEGRELQNVEPKPIVSLWKLHMEAEEVTIYDMRRIYISILYIYVFIYIYIYDMFIYIYDMFVYIYTHVYIWTKWIFHVEVNGRSKWTPCKSCFQF